jgi:Flp pilus assembly protein TadG
VSKGLPGRRSAGRADRGSGSLEFAVLSVAFLLLVFTVVQAALYYHARNVVKAEAEGVARAVRAYPSTVPNAGAPQDAVPTSDQVRSLAEKSSLVQWDRLDGSGHTTSKPRIDRAEVVGFDQVQVTISADPIMILPGLFGSKLTITETAGGPFEIFKRSGDG